MSHYFIHRELKKCSISIKLKFSAALPKNIEIFIIGENLAQFLWILSAGFEISPLKQLMDKDDVIDLIQKCRKLEYNFSGVFTANNFPQKLLRNSFLIAKASPSTRPGTYWLLLYNRNNKIIFAGKSIFAYRDLYHRLSDNKAQVFQFLEHQPFQSENSELFGLFYIYMAYVIISEIQIVNINVVQLLRFALHRMFYYLLNKIFFFRI